MGNPTGFMEFDLFERPYKPVIERIQHYHEFFIPLNDEELTRQGARCMDCGIPYCQQGCPVDNIIPDWNDLVYRGDFAKASKILHSTNNFPEFTGRVCPAPCQEACTLNIQDTPVTIKTIECAIVDRAWQEGWLAPEPAAQMSGKKVAVVGSGPAGMACAQQLARAGHLVTLFEKNQKIGGLMRYGIPDFKMEKHLIDRRGEQMQGEGVTLETGVHVGADISAETLLADFDAVALTGGSEAPRDLPLDGRELDGVHFAMDFLVQQNRRVAGEPLGDVNEILATGRNVIVIGGGDTGSDCVGTSIRQGAKNVVQIEIMPKPPEKVDKGSTWPEWPMKLRNSSSHQEGAVRDWAITTEQFIGEDGAVHALDAVRVAWKAGDDGRLAMAPIADTRQSLKAELVLLAMGFVHPTHEGMITDLGVGLDGRGNVEANTNDYQTSVAKVFAAGDMRRGQSLVVWAIREGRQCAAAIDEYLMGQTLLPR
jgi:glutamate synthase (NADPH/NADH) small chain